MRDIVGSSTSDEPEDYTWSSEANSTSQPPPVPAAVVNATATLMATGRPLVFACHHLLANVAHTRSRLESKFFVATVSESSALESDARYEMCVTEIRRLLEDARDDVFEDGMISSLRRSLDDVRKRCGSTSIEAATMVLVGDSLPSAPQAEALRWLAGLQDESTIATRRWLAERCLTSASVVMRDSALGALDDIGDRVAIVYLKQAAERESIAWLKREMLSTAERLAEQHAAPPA